MAVNGRVGVTTRREWCAAHGVVGSNVYDKIYMGMIQPNPEHGRQ